MSEDATRFVVDGQTFLARRRPKEPGTFDITWESGPAGRGLSVGRFEVEESGSKHAVEWTPTLAELERLARDLIDLEGDEKLSST